jgi:hypothetical protein
MDSLRQHVPRSPAGLLAVLATVVFALQCFSDNKADVDLWGNVGFVRSLPGADGFHMTNTFSYTAPDHPWINHEWLAEWVFYRVWSALGSPGLLGLKVLLGLALLGLAAAKARRDGSRGPVLFLYLLAALSTLAFGFGTRPHLFTYLLYACVLFFLTAPALRARLWAPFAAACVLWTNLHGAFFIGIILLAVWAVAETVEAAVQGRVRAVARRTAGLLGAAALFAGLSLLNPYGAGLWNFIRLSAAETRPYLSEWAPFHPLRDALTHLDFLVLTGVTVLGLVFTRRPRRAAPLAVLTLSLAAAVLMRRNIPLFALTAVLLATPHVVSAFDPAVSALVARLRPGLRCLLPGALAAACVLYGWHFGKTAPLHIEIESKRFPVRTMALLRAQRLTGNLLVFFDWAEYAVWHLHPGCRVFLDGRFASAYPLPVIADYFAFLYGGGNWRRALEAYETDMLLLHIDNPATALVETDPDWALVLRDPPAALFLKRGRHAETIAALRRAPESEYPANPLFP